MPEVVVVGGGVAGLSAAWMVQQRGLDVLLLESTDRVGGKVRRAGVAGRAVDVGAEALLWRRAEGRDLVENLGLEATHPAPVGSSVWSRGALHPMPSGTLMGIPSDPDRLAGLLTPEEISRVRHEQVVEVADDLPLGELIAGALGDAVVDRLVEPLLGGVYAGHARLLSAEACLPQVKSAGERGDSLLSLAGSAASQAAERVDEPVFGTVSGGLAGLPERVAQDLLDGGATIRTGSVVRAMARVSGRWRLTLGETRAPEQLDADAVVLATPAAPTSRLLAPHAPEAGRALATIEYASMVIVTYAFARASVPESMRTRSGFLVPPVDGRRIKAATFSSAKWPWLAEAEPDLTYARVSLGRHREESALQVPDAELIAVGLADLGEALGGELPLPVDAHVQRWGGGLPQYLVGHRERVARIMRSAGELPGVALAGAAYDGVGIPACIGSGARAAESVATHLGRG